MNRVEECVNNIGVFGMDKRYYFLLAKTKM